MRAVEVSEAGDGDGESSDLEVEEHDPGVLHCQLDGPGRGGDDRQDSSGGGVMV